MCLCVCLSLHCHKISMHYSKKLKCMHVYVCHTIKFMQEKQVRGYWSLIRAKLKTMYTPLHVFVCVRAHVCVWMCTWVCLHVRVTWTRGITLTPLLHKVLSLCPVFSFPACKSATERLCTGRVRSRTFRLLSCSSESADDQSGYNPADTEDYKHT